MSDYKQTRDAAGNITSQYGQMLRNLDDGLVKRLRTSWDASRSIISQTDIWMRERHEAADSIEELEANINLKADFIDAKLNQLAASEQRIEELESSLAKAEVIVRIIASDKWEERLGEAVDLSCEYLAELMGDEDDE